MINIGFFANSIPNSLAIEMLPRTAVINEGSSRTYMVSTSLSEIGNTFYWNIDNGSSTDFVALNGSFIINSSGNGSFIVEVRNDSLSFENDPVTYNLTLRSDSITGTILDIVTFQVNDTSPTNTTPPPPTSAPNNGDGDGGK